jgi:hypothetical protein
MAQEITLSYPQFSPILQHWKAEEEIPRFRGGNSWGEPPSVYPDFIHSTLNIIWRNPHSSELADQVRGLPTCELLGLKTMQPEPWHVPSVDNI